MSYALLIEDHPLMAEAVANSLGLLLPGLALSRAYSWAEAQAVLQGVAKPPVFIVTDLQLPGSPPQHTLQSLRLWQPRVPMLALTMLDDAATHRLCDQHQVRYLCKTTEAQHWYQTLQDWLGPEIFLRWGVVPAPQSHPLSDLTTRHLAILRELANGASNREIAATLSISEDTVRSHIKAVFTRLNVKNRTQASKLFLQHQERLRAPKP